MLMVVCVVLLGGNGLKTLITLIISFWVPGAGHLFLSLHPSWEWSSRDRKLFKRAIYFALAYLVSCILAFVSIGFILAPIVIILAMIDSYRQAKKIL